MKVYNWDSWEQCLAYFHEVYPASRPNGITYQMSQLSGFFLHWKEHKRLCQKALDDLNVGVDPHDTITLSENYIKVLKENNIKNFNDNLNEFLDEFNYTIYV